MEERYGTQQKALVDRWLAQLEGFGKRLIASAEKNLAEGNPRAAYLETRRLMDLWPETPGAKELIEKVTDAYPIAIVAVSQPFVEGHNYRNYRAGERCDRLLRRRLFEMVDVGAEGGRYICPFGTYRLSDDATSARIDLTELQKSSSPVSALTIARRLRELASPSYPDYVSTIANLFDQASAKQVYDLEISLRRPHLRMESLLSVELESGHDSIVPYRVGEADEDGSTVFVLNPEYALQDKSQPQEIIERRYDNSQAAISALRRGEIDVVERIFPGDINLAKNDTQIRVGSYRVPSTHILIPNYSKKVPSSRAFRVALLYGIDRNRILRREILGGNDVQGCRVISGPFSPGLSRDDPLSYGYNTSLDPRPYDPRLAKLRFEIARIGLREASKESEEDMPDMSKIVLAHPDDELCELAAEEIAKNIKIFGFECELQTIPLGSSRPDNNDWDFLYADLRVVEPLRDANDLLGSDGFAQSASPYLNLALRQLDKSDNWVRAAQRLHAIHQKCVDEVSILPLWQIADHFAYRPEVEGLQSSLVYLYQDIEKWRITAK